MLRLYASPDTASTVLRLVAGQAGIDLDLVAIDYDRATLGSDSYLKMNPTGTIPVLFTKDGPVSETAACLLWLAEAHALAPLPGQPGRAAFLKWLFYISNTLHADLNRLVRPWRFVGSEGEAGFVTLHAARVLTSLALIEAAMDEHPALFRPLGPLSAYLVMLMRWAAQYPSGHPRWFHLEAFPELAAHAATVEALPLARKLTTEEEMGAHPFTAPEPAPRPSA